MAPTLVLTCQSFRIAGLMASIAGLSVGLALASLWVFGYPFGFTALVGTMGLVGIAVNEAIVMLVAFRHHPRARLGEPEAMHTVILDETRHMLSTSITTIVGFVPLLIDGGGFWPPLAIAIAGGVSGATLLGVSFAPAAYRLLMCRCVTPTEPQTATKVLVPV